MARACARHILVNTLEAAKKLQGQIARGEDFGKLAKQHSLCPSRKRGGDLGEFSPGQMAKAFDQVVFKKPVLEVHGPVKTQFGYHLIQIIYRT